MKRISFWLLTGAVVFTIHVMAEASDYVHNSGFLVELVAPYSTGYQPGYAYYYTDPEYFDSLTWNSSPQQEDRSRANSDGTLGEFKQRYYAAHADSGYGQKILGLKGGEHVTIDGIEYIIDGSGMTYEGESVREVIDMSGNADLLLLTCLEGNYPAKGHPERAVWGHAVHPEQVDRRTW